MNKLQALAAAQQGEVDPSPQLRRLVRLVAWCVLAVGIIHGLLGTVGLALFLAGSRQRDAQLNPGQLLPMASIGLYDLAALYGVLAWCALSRPLFSAMTASLQYACWLGVWALKDPHSLVQGWVLEVLIAAALGQSLLAGLRYHRLAGLPARDGSLRPVDRRGPPPQGQTGERRQSL
jgi:hypothetical protein